MAGCQLLPKKLGDTVAEYLRQRESGILDDQWTISTQVAQLLRAAALSHDARETVHKTREALLEHDSAHLVIQAISDRVQEALYAEDNTTALNAFMQQVRESKDELCEQVASVIAGSIAVVLSSTSDLDAILVSDDIKSGGTLKNTELRVIASPQCMASAEKTCERALKSGAKTAVLLQDKFASSALIGANHCVLVGRASHMKHGIACASGARILARAAKRLGIAVVVAVAKHAVLSSDSDSGVRRGRVHPGALWSYEGAKNGVEIVAKSFDWVPAHDVDLVLTEDGAYDARYLFERCRVEQRGA